MVLQFLSFMTFMVLRIQATYFAAYPSIWVSVALKKKKDFICFWEF